MKSSPLWAITTYYNPVKYRRRTENYLSFRESLSVPMIVVELSSDGSFEIAPDENTIVIRVRSPTVLWHKETLLNYAIKFLPDHAKYVAWVDCDIVFQDRLWVSQALDALERYPLIQLFSDLYDLDPDGSLRPGCAPTGQSVATQYFSGSSTILGGLLRPQTEKQVRKTAYGLAWAAHTALLRQYKFYDAMIMGGGDIALVCAAFGRFSDAIDTLKLSPGHARHYLAWAEPFYAAVKGEVACLPGEVHHLWHGDIANRAYMKRHEMLYSLNFDPEHDLQRGQDDMWSWTNPSAPLQKMVKEYFSSRREDEVVGQGSEKVG